ncbi:hypothetical protein KTO58_26565 [Chitinophaga pendula]|uniref:hypothetical protein n=1 Tax=Chitinophaga TaxID=79328 RepID=UPI000BAFA266|nr:MULTISPECIES: hypothetical protein [Chitinophaga]ASZ09873.1 hypothetical protein CK934_02200 [Chitinophaga sp. MD30]UCJ07185.1 hypothetical protein KTO58_26565 [Chitinophaga pendula]
MEEYPILAGNQVALLRAAFDTGHVLDEDQRLAINSDQKVYTVFENIDEALIAASEIINGNKNIECVIYDKDENPMHYLTYKDMNCL